MNIVQSHAQTSIRFCALFLPGFHLNYVVLSFFLEEVVSAVPIVAGLALEGLHEFLLQRPVRA
jgi:hypothetical protein